MRNNFYNQCLLERPCIGGKERMVSWIPEDIAKCGNNVRLKSTHEKECLKDGWY